MQISSTNARFVPNSGPSIALPTVRKPAVELSTNGHAGVSSAVNAPALPQIPPPVVSADTATNVANNADASRALMQARQRAGVGDLPGNVQTSGLNSRAGAQRAVTEYNNVATQEQRFELSSVLAGIDVFA